MYLPGKRSEEGLVSGAAAAVGQDLVPRLLPLAHVDHCHFVRLATPATTTHCLTQRKETSIDGVTSIIIRHLFTSIYITNML